MTFFSCALNPVYEILPNNGHEVDLTAQKFVWCFILGLKDLGYPVMRKKEELQVRECILPCCLLHDTEEPQALVNFFPNNHFPTVCLHAYRF